MIWSVILFGISANADSLLISLSYGIKKVRIPFLSKILIALIGLAGIIAAKLIADSVAKYLSDGIADKIGNGMLILFGLIGVIKYLKDRFSSKTKPERPAKKISLKETIFIGLALSINNIGMGIGIFISGFPFFPVAAVSVLLNFIFLMIGNRLGNSFLAKYLGRYGEIAAAIIIILLGICGLLF